MWFLDLISLRAPSVCWNETNVDYVYPKNYPWPETLFPHEGLTAGYLGILSFVFRLQFNLGSRITSRYFKLKGSGDLCPFTRRRWNSCITVLACLLASQARVDGIFRFLDSFPFSTVSNHSGWFFEYRPIPLQMAHNIGPNIRRFKDRHPQVFGPTFAKR